MAHSPRWAGKGDEAVALAERAVALAERAVAIAVDLGESSYELSAIHELAYVCGWAGLHGPAPRTCQRAIELSRELGSPCLLKPGYAHEALRLRLCLQVEAD